MIWSFVLYSLWPLILWVGWFSSDDIYYQSGVLEAKHFVGMDRRFTIYDDEGLPVHVTGLFDEDGIPFWKRRLKTGVCLTGECKSIDIAIYWEMDGDYFGLEVYGEHLTKTDHSDFSTADYEKLEAVLHEEWPNLREYSLHEIVEEPGGEEVDGVSGATIKEVTDESVADAVYTTYTIWHLAHEGEKEQLSRLTLEILQEETMIQRVLSTESSDHKRFLLREINAGRLRTTPVLDKWVIGNLTSNEKSTKDLAFRSLRNVDVNDGSIQDELTVIYNASSNEDKILLLSHLKNISQLTPDLREALVGDLQKEDEWFDLKVLTVLKSTTGHTMETIDILKRLSKSGNHQIKSIVNALLNKEDE
ncbi:FMN-binding protein [Negadavirga shengliensis]|uniref:FMN-binding protein n=1 Tax=Negadavirga shengliensis TaxID=1389218 RepID=A0ABV9SYZ1_9BACT